MTTPPGADEHRARLNLIRALNGPRLTPPPTPPAPERAPDDWWDRLYGDTKKPSGKPKPARGRSKAAPEAGDVWEDAEPDDESSPQAVRRGTHNPARRAHDAYTALNPRTRVLVYNGSAAGGGWCFGLGQLFSGWITACQHDTGHVGAALALGVGMVIACGVLIDWRTRHWWGPLPWLCRIPLASAVLALALYAPGVTQ